MCIRDRSAIALAARALAVIRTGVPVMNILIIGGGGREHALAWKAAQEDARQSGSLEVPVHLRNAPTRLMKELGYGHDYRYAHDEPEGYAAGEVYFPDGLRPRRYYAPVDRGLEIRIREKLVHLRELDRLARAGSGAPVRGSP